ncbi:MAG TPA: transcriptional repressor LexA [Longimicrobiales bacterium]
MPEPLTQVERRILDFMIEFVRRNTYQPSIREIGRQFDIKSTKTVSEYLQSLADKGWVERDPARSRGVRLLGVDLSPGTVTVPWYGAISPEDPALSRDAIVDEFQIDRRLVGSNGVYFLAMRGNSMEGMGIRDGDLLLVEPVPAEELEDGNIVVGRLADRTVVQRFFRRDGEIVLETGNPAFPPTRLTDPRALEVLGRVIAIFRRLLVPATEPAVPVTGGEGP